MKNFNKIMKSLNDTVTQLKALSAKNRIAKKAKQNKIKKIEQKVTDLSVEEAAAAEIAKKLEALYMPTNTKKL